jgi:uncharacterized protein YdhG (YjbR/CyaY superfamily)
MNEEIKNYIDKVTDSRKELFYSIHDLIIRLYPDIESAISYGIPKYYYSANEWVFVSYNKKGVSVHVGYKGKLQEFRDKHPGFNTGKACLHLSPRQIIPWEDLEILITSAVRS